MKEYMIGMRYGTIATLRIYKEVRNMKTIITILMIVGMFKLTITKSNGEVRKYNLSLLNIISLILLYIYFL